MASGSDVLTFVAVGLAAIAAIMSASHAVDTQQRVLSQIWPTDPPGLRLLLTISAASV